MLPAKLALPVATGLIATQMSVEGAMGNRLVLVTAPPGGLMTSQLSRQLSARQMRVIRLHAGTEDTDPATLLLDIAAGIDSVYPGTATRTFETMRRQPGSVFGWPALYQSLSRDLGEAVRANGEMRAAFVVEHINALQEKPEALSLLCGHFLPRLPNGISGILTRHWPAGRAGLPGWEIQLGLRDLRMDVITAITLARQAGVNLSTASLNHLAEITEGRGTAIMLVLEAAQRLGITVVQGCIQAAAGLDDLLQRVMCLTLEDTSRDERLALALAAQIGFLHPDLLQTIQAGPHLPACPSPWLQNRTGGWLRLHSVCRGPILKLLPGPEDAALRKAMQGAAKFYSQQGATEQALPLLFSLGMDQDAAQMLTQVAETMLDRGQWQTLSGWIDRLPKHVLNDWPWLLYYQGEIAAALGRQQSARRNLSVAIRIFAGRGELAGVCQSLLTQSSLAALHGHQQEAHQYAQQVYMVAELGKLSWYHGWAGWQLGCLAALSGQAEEALSNFRHAANTAMSINDSRMTAFIDQICGLTQASMEQQQQIEVQRQALAAAEHERQVTLSRLHEIITSPADYAGGLVSYYGWARTPLALKLPQRMVKSQPLGQVAAWFFERFQAPARSDTRLPAPLLGEDNPTVDPQPAAEGQQPKPEEERASALAAVSAFPVDASKSMVPVTSGAEPIDQPPLQAPPQVVELHAFLLGEFRVMVNERLIPGWPGGRGRAIFAFLLLQRSHCAHREVLMETFWPDSDPDAARNNLNVAIHNLRAVFRQEAARSVILRDENIYRIDPQLALWLDFTVFEQHVKAGEKLERSGMATASIIAEYEAALHLYQGDFLADHPFDEWAILERERLRVLYLETLDHMSMIHFNEGSYNACIRLCQRMIAHDACREDAHCRLMCCYYHEGQAHLALRQYQVCVESLRSELNVDPSPNTIDLYDKIRRRVLE